MTRGAQGDPTNRHGCLEEGTLSKWLRIGSIKTRVQEAAGEFRRPGRVARAYGFVVQDVVRVKNRLKSVLRSRGVGYERRIPPSGPPPKQVRVQHGRNLGVTTCLLAREAVTGICCRAGAAKVVYHDAQGHQ
ncbi:MAG TPA: hypothetical protein VLA09_00160 [Longimicrobiales bacterium]|nr:hypothetical protein [Longimicrobiales bacterium]